MDKSNINTLVPKAQLPYLNKRAQDAWEKYQAIKAEKKRLEARIQELKKAEGEQDAILKTQFWDGEGERRLPGGILLSRHVIHVKDKVVTPEMVGSVITRGYSYPLYKELEA